MSSKMEELVERFKTEAAARVERIEQQLQGIADLDSSEVAARCNEIREEAHKLKGAAGVLGFPNLKDRAAALEEEAATQRESGGTVSEGPQPSGKNALAALTPLVGVTRRALP